MITLEEYLFHANATAVQVEDAQKFIALGQQKLSRDVYQEDLADYHHYIIQTLDDYLNELNYFKTIGKFERMKMLRQQKDYIDIKLPAIKILDSDNAIDEEINDAIETAFQTLEILREAMDEDKKKEILAFNSEGDEFTELTGMGRFVERDDMNDRMEYNFWLHFSRRLHLYELSEEMASNLDAFESDPEERYEAIKARLRGREQEMFPPQMCTLDGFSEEEIEMAKHVIAEEDAQAAENELDGDAPDNVIDMFDDDESEWNGDNPDEDITGDPPLRYPRKTDDVADIFDTGSETPKPSNNNNKNGGKLADVIPLDRFRKKPDPPKP